MNKAMTALAFVFAFVLCAKAGDGVSGFTHGTSFENQEIGPFSSDSSDEDGSGVYWAKAEKNRFAIVTNYVAGAAYDYEARNMERGVNGCFTGPNQKYLAVDIDSPLERLVAARESDDSILNVPVTVTNAYDGIYADTLAKFTPSVAAPAVDGTDKIVVWMRESETNGRAVTNLIVTAGYYDGSYDNVKSADYVIETPVVAADTWCRLTLCAISDITGVKKASGNVMRAWVPGFVVYLDGTQAVARAECPIGWGYHADWLTPSARVLIGERGLFPWLVRRGHDDAMTLSRLSFSGQGAVDDMLITTTRPSLVEVDNVFTLQWDSGVKSMRCIVSNAVLVATNEIDAVGQPRSWDYRLGTNVNSVVTVTNVVYDTANGYSNGVWSAESACRLEGCSFACYGTNPVGRVASSRDVVGVGGESGYATFAEAKARAKTRPAYLELMTNMLVSMANTGSNYRDNGYLWVTNGDDIVLDLKGCTLQGRRKDAATIVQTGGKLRIVDSVGGGAVLPATGSTVAVQSTKYFLKNKVVSVDESHVTDIKAGRYAGEVRLTGGGNNNPYCGVCIIDGGSFTNYNDGATFYLEQYVTNTSLYFSRDVNNYWATAAQGFIWCGKGSNDLWTTAENWKGAAVPGAGDLAIFPVATNDLKGWSVDFGTGVDTKSLWMDADIFMAGTNVFTGVTVSSTGRLERAGTAVFTKVLPGRLTGETGSGEIRLGSGWRGTVRISKITSAKVLRDLTWWGLAGSKVEFAGVRGYLSDKANYAVPYELVLTDADGTVAWQNDTGYTGSIVSFPKLSGSGTFKSPKNLREVLQVFQFGDVADFTGGFSLGGKRLLLGPGSVAQASKAGDFTFANDVAVRSGLDWSGVNAHFGESLYVRGETNDVLMTFTSKTTVPSVENVTVMLVRPDLTTNECSLAIAGTNIVVTNVVKMSRRETMVGGNSVLAENVGKVVKNGETIEIPLGSAVSIDGNRVIINGRVVSSVPGYYTLNKVVKSNGATAVAVSFNEAEVTPSLAEFSLSSGAGAVITVQNAKPGLMYGLRAITSLAQAWEDAPVTWKQATGDTVTFEPTVSDASAFYQVIVTEPDGPKGGVQ